MDTVERTAPDLERFRTYREIGDEWVPLYHSGYPNFRCVHLRDTFYTALILDDVSLLWNGTRYAAATQGRKSNPLNGEEPGKMMHEDACLDPDAQSNRYNACDTTALYLIALERATLLTGDWSPVRAALSPMREAIIRYLLPHVSSTGLFEDGPAFQGGDRPLGLSVTYWKDSRVPGRAGDDRGGIPVYPVTYSLAHVQTLAGLRSGARLLRALGQDSLARTVEETVRTMLVALTDQLWDEKESTFLIGIDALGPLRGISSDALHLLAFLQPGDFPPGMIARLVSSTRVLETPLGYRTLDPALAYSSPRLSPYHSRTVWPFEQAVIHHGASVHASTARGDDAAALGRVQQVARRVIARLEMDAGTAPEAYLLEGPFISGLADPAIHPHGCSWQLWTAAARCYFRHR